MNNIQLIEYKCDMHHYPIMDNVCNYKQFTVHEDLIVPEGKPDIEDLLEVRAYPHIDVCKSIDTPFGKKFIIIGNITQKILYVANVSCQSVHFFHASRPFCTFLEIPHHKSICSTEFSEHAQCHPEIMVEYLCAHKVGDREVAKCLILVVWFSKHAHHSPDSHCHPPYPPIPHDYHMHCGGSITNCSTCQYSSTCVLAKKKEG